MSTTCPDFESRRQLGFTMISMLFILVVLVALGAAMARFSMRQQLGFSSELAASKAMQSANAGLEWANLQILRGASAPACFANTNIALTGNLSDFVVTVNCSLSSGSDGGTIFNFYQVTATACNAPTAGACPTTANLNPSYVERQLTRRLVR
ncbi:agglutinin biogenesis protein MshP [Roseateles koreensis]|uniref:Agglutinin biogenesis protein MshP n=1 Tax=Roseateles koreensis TaxID=2987526 RepID=A0ABT5KNM4_9BURK|nr:agglutinin biogenesis protein MshP [Roseateles koreensis]MDC8784452.1 agglutinin biogenesis protein MshP [Roseateles koreensis]